MNTDFNDFADQAQSLESFEDVKTAYMKYLADKKLIADAIARMKGKPDEADEEIFGSFNIGSQP